jgi:biopolymer transport protein ExbD
MKIESSHKPISALNYSSLIDIVFLLLLFFLLSSQFVMQTGIKVKLPGSKNNDHVRQSGFSVSVTDQNKIYAGSEEISLSMLTAKFVQIKPSLENENLVIRADKAVKIDLVIKIMDAAKEAGIDKFILLTEKISL